MRSKTLRLETSASACRFKSCHPHLRKSTPCGCFFVGLLLMQGLEAQGGLLRSGTVQRTVPQGRGVRTANTPPVWAVRAERIAKQDLSCHPHQSNIIRTRSSLWETGSDYLFISRSMRIRTSETVLWSVLPPSQEDQEKRNNLDYGGFDYEKTY